jgi:hypothetical protein
MQVFRPKNSVTIVTDVDDIDVRDGSCEFSRARLFGEI